MFNLLVRVRCTSFPEIRVICLLTLAFLFCVKYPFRLCSFESKKFWNLHFFLRTRYRQMVRGSVLTWTGVAVQILLTCFASSLFFHTPVSPILVHVVFSGVFQRGEGWWLHPSHCSFGENTDAGHHFSSLHLKINQRMKIHQKGICIILWGESFCLNNQSLR